MHPPPPPHHHPHPLLPTHTHATQAGRTSFLAGKCVRLCVPVFSCHRVPYDRVPVRPTMCPCARAPVRLYLCPCVRLQAACCDRLPQEYYAPWEELARQLPSLSATGTLHDAIANMPELSIVALRGSDAELRRAYLILGHLVHALAFADDVPWPEIIGGTARPRRDQSAPRKVAVVPAQLARPWSAVCNELGLPCILVSAGVDTWNWAAKDGYASPKPVTSGPRIRALAPACKRRHDALGAWHGAESLGCWLLTAGYWVARLLGRRQERAALQRPAGHDVHINADRDSVGDWVPHGSVRDARACWTWRPNATHLRQLCACGSAGRS